jgi:hypothetical protein
MELTEYSPKGERLRAFCGGRGLGTRLAGNVYPVFAPDGTLLVTSTSLQDALLEFREGGRSVRALTEGCFTQVAVTERRLFAAQSSTIGCVVKEFDRQGKFLRTIGYAPAGEDYFGLAVTSRGWLYVERRTSEGSRIEVFDMDGIMRRSFLVPGLRNARLIVDANDCLYVPCRLSGDIKIVSPDGAIERCLPLPDRFAPHGVTLDATGLLWVWGYTRTSR